MMLVIYVMGLVNGWMEALVSTSSHVNVPNVHLNMQLGEGTSSPTLP